MKNFFIKTTNRTIYRGTKESASITREMYNLPTETQARAIDRQEQAIKQLEKRAKTDPIARFYMYGY